MSCCFPLSTRLKEKFKKNVENDLKVSLIDIPDLSDESSDDLDMYKPPQVILEKTSNRDYIEYISSLSSKKIKVKRVLPSENRATIVSLCFQVCLNCGINGQIFEYSVYIFDIAMEQIKDMKEYSGRHTMMSCLIYSYKRLDFQEKETTEKLLEKFGMLNAQTVILSLMKKIDLIFSDSENNNSPLLFPHLAKWNLLLNNDEKMNVALYLFYLRTLNHTLFHDSMYNQVSSILFLSNILFPNYLSCFETPIILFGSNASDVRKHLQKMKLLFGVLNISTCCISQYFLTTPTKSTKIVNNLYEKILTKETLSKFS